MKKFNTMYGVGSAKYVVNFHDGVGKHKDGSRFYGMKLFKNKKRFSQFIKQLLEDGYKESQMEIYN